MVVNGVIYFGSIDNSLYALNASNGQLIWNFQTKDQIWSSPAVANGVVYIGSFDHSFYALDANTDSVGEFNNEPHSERKFLCFSA